MTAEELIEAEISGFKKKMLGTGCKILRLDQRPGEAERILGEINRLRSEQEEDPFFLTERFERIGQWLESFCGREPSPIHDEACVGHEK